MINVLVIAFVNTALSHRYPTSFVPKNALVNLRRFASILRILLLVISMPISHVRHYVACM
jgi:hypothetical protein